MVKLQKEILVPIHDESLLRDPDAFMTVVLRYLEELMIFVNKATESVFEIIISLSKRIEKAYEEGYVYSQPYNYYYNEEYFDFELFSSKIIEMLNAVSEPKEQVNAFLNFALLCKQSDYYGLSYKELEVKDENLLRDLLDEIETLEFFHYIRNLLSSDVQEKFLKQFEPHLVFHILTELYMGHDEKEKAISYAESLLEQSSNVEYAKFLMEVSDISQERLRGFIESAINNGCYGTYDFIVENIKQCDEVEAIEVLFREKCVSKYYDYLGKEKRIDEIYKLLKKIPGNRLDFFEKYKKFYRSEAIVFFKEAINKELAFTGNDHYCQIAGHLAHLWKLISKDELDHIVCRLKTEYKRRRNFVAILNEKFGDR